MKTTITLLASASLAFTTTLALAASATGTTQSAQGENLVLIEGKTLRTTHLDFQAELQKVPPERRNEFLASSERIRKSLEANFSTQVLAAEAKKLGLHEDKTIKAQIDSLVATELARIYLAKLDEQQTLPDMEARAKDLYNASKENLGTKESAAVSHILITNRNRTNADAIKLAEELRQRALSGEDFAKLAEEFSEDRTAKTNKGFLDFINYDKVAAPFASAASRMTQPGEISPVTQTQFGWHIIKLHAKRGKSTPAYEEVKEQFLKTAQDEFRAKRMQELITEKVAAEKPEINIEQVNKLVRPLEQKKMDESVAEIHRQAAERRELIRNMGQQPPSSNPSQKKGG